VEFVLLEQPTIHGEDWVLTVPDALGIVGDTQIGLKRKSRIMQVGHTDTGEPKENQEEEKRCSLCGDRMQPGNRAALAVDNIRPFGPLLHQVVFSRVHLHSLNQVGQDEVRESTELFFEIARTSRDQDGHSIDGLVPGMSFGKYILSGASQQHFHYQVTGLGPANFNAGDRLGELCQLYQQSHGGTDYLADYESALRKAGLVVAEAANGRAFAYAPISPRFKGEAQIMLSQRPHGKQPGNILDTTTGERDALAELQYKVMRRHEALGCRALNQVWYMTRFSANNDWGQRRTICVCPRTSIMAFYELFGNSVIDTEPWNSAQTIRGEEVHYTLRP
jgi:galactose-1-phosphate uridylyltransferase